MLIDRPFFFLPLPALVVEVFFPPELLSLLTRFWGGRPPLFLPDKASWLLLFYHGPFFSLLFAGMNILLLLFFPLPLPGTVGRLCPSLFPLPSQFRFFFFFLPPPGELDNFSLDGPHFFPSFCFERRDGIPPPLLLASFFPSCNWYR